MSQVSLIKNKLKQSIKNDVDAQITDLSKGLAKMKTFINNSQDACKLDTIKKNYKFLQEYIHKLIEELEKKLQEYPKSFEGLNLKSDTNLIEIFNSAEVNFKQFYEEYEFIHSQIYFFNERKIILQKEDPDRDFKLIYDILNPVDE